MMKFFRFSGIALMAVFCGANVQAADWQEEVRQLREDVQILQRQVYRGTEAEKKATISENAGVQSKIGEYDEVLRTITGRLDVLEHQIQQNNEKLDRINRDIEIRMKILEGRPIPANLSAPAPKLPTTYDAPVADKPASAVMGDKIHGGDLEPLDGGPQPLLPLDNMPTEPQNVVNADKPEDMYANAMQAYNSGFYDEAELAFADILSRFPQHNLAGNAQYWLGEVYFKQGDLNKAKSAFKNGYEKYKTGNKAPDSLYRLGMTLSKQNDKQRACIVFMSFAEEFPKAGTDLKNKAKAEATKLGCK